MSVGNWDQHRATSFKWKEKKEKKIAATLFQILKNCSSYDYYQK